jgi:hypothetical protein
MDVLIKGNLVIFLLFLGFVDFFTCYFKYNDSFLNKFFFYFFLAPTPENVSVSRFQSLGYKV